MNHSTSAAGFHPPYGYKLTDKGMVPDPYQAKVVRLIFDLVVAGVFPDEVEYLLPKYKVPKLTKERKIDFKQLKLEMLQEVQAWRLEEGRKPLEINF